MSAKTPIKIPISLREENLLADSLEVIKILKPNWKIENIKPKVYNGGTSNKLSGFYLEGKKDEMVMVRLYGQNTDTMIDRQAEINAIKLLHENNCGAELYAILDNGICYEFIPGDTLTMKQALSQPIYSAVAKQLAKMHSKISIPKNSKSMIWQKVDTFNELIKGIFEGGKNATLLQRFSGFGFDVSKGFDTEINELKRIIEAENMPITFCHNDLSFGNALYNDKNSTVSFIDFEWAMPNYAPFDVANHFTEYGGVENPDFSKCPGPEFKAKWIAEYLKHFQNQKFSAETFAKWVELCMPLPHLCWGLWAMVQAQHSTIDFDFVGYATIRYTEYDKLMKQVRENLL